MILVLIVAFVLFESAQSDLFAPADGDYIEPIDTGNDDDDDNMNSGFPDQVFDPWAPVFVCLFVGTVEAYASKDCDPVYSSLRSLTRALYGVSWVLLTSQ